MLPEAEEALHRAVIASRIVLTEEDLGGTLDWSPEGVFVTEGPENTGMIDLRDATTGESVRSWIGHENSDVNDVQFSNDGSMLATAGDDGFLKIWDPDTGEEIASVRGTTSAWGQSFDADGRLVAAAWPEEGVVRVAEAATGKIVRTFDGLDTYVVDTALSPDGSRLAIASAGADFASVFDVRTGDFLFDAPAAHQLRVRRLVEPGRAMDRHGARPTHPCASGTRRPARSRSGCVGHTGVVNTVDWSPDSRRIVSGGSDGTARVWELEVHPTRGTVEVEGRQVYLLSAQQTQSGLFAAFSPDGRRVLTGDVVIAAVKIWDLSIEGDAEVINVPTDHQGLVDVAYLPDGRVVASHDRGSVAIWDVRGDATEPVATLGPGTGSENPVFLVASSPDGELVAFVRNDASVVSVWNVETGTLAFDYDVRSGVITSIDWSGDGRYLAVGTWVRREPREPLRTRRRRRRAPGPRRIRTGPHPSRSPSRRTGGRSPPRPTTNRIRTRATCRSGTRRRGGRAGTRAWRCRRSPTTGPESGSRSGPTTGPSRSATPRRATSSDRSVRDRSPS